MMSNYKKLDDFDIHWVYELTFVQIRNNLIFIKNKHEHEPYVLCSPISIEQKTNLSIIASVCTYSLPSLNQIDKALNQHYGQPQYYCGSKTLKAKLFALLISCVNIVSIQRSIPILLLLFFCPTTLESGIKVPLRLLIF